jgi:hypothetical protein
MREKVEEADPNPRNRHRMDESETIDLPRQRLHRTSDWVDL